jgi:hypothetical protein
MSPRRERLSFFRQRFSHSFKDATELCDIFLIG